MQSQAGTRSFGAISLSESHLLTGSGVYPLANISSAQMVKLPGSDHGRAYAGGVVGIVMIVLGLVSLIQRAPGEAYAGAVAMLVVGGVFLGVGVLMGRKQTTAIVLTMVGGESLTVACQDERSCRALLPALAQAIQSVRGPQIHVDNRQVHVHNPPPQIK